MNPTQYDIMKKTRSILNESPVKLYLCTINSVDTESLTAEVFVAGIASTIKNVPVLGFSRAGDSGIITLPVANSMGILAITAKRHNVLLGTISTASSAQIAEKLFQGEMLYQSPGGAYVKLDRKGNVLIGSSANGLILMDTEGRVAIWSETIMSTSAAQKITSGNVSGRQGVREEVFIDKAGSEDTIEQLVDKIMRDNDVVMTSPLPCIIIEKGTVTDDDGAIETLAIHDNPNDDVEMVARIRVKDTSSGADKASIAFDAAGNIKLSGDMLHLDFKTVKTTYITKIDDPIT